MKFTIIYVISFILSSICMILGAMFKILHLPFGAVILSIGFLLALVYVVLGLSDISRRPLELSAKLMWFLGFIFMPLITGLVYILVYPKKTFNRVQG